MRRTIGIVGALALAACGGEAGTLFGDDGADGFGSASGEADAGQDAVALEDGAAEAGGLCVPGQAVSCACIGGLVGAQQCLSSGDGYGPCECPDGPDAGDGGDDPADAGPDAPDEDDGGGIVDAGPDAPNWGDSGDVCAPAQCIPKGVAGINCDPDCGPVSSQCAAACDSFGHVKLTPGVLWVRTPPVAERVCTQCSKDPLSGQEPNLWAMGFRIDPEPYCLTITGPEGSVARPGGWGHLHQGSNVCYGNGGWGDGDTGCGRWREFYPSLDRVGFFTIGLREPTPGALFRIEFRTDPDSCPASPQCVGGCNGDGALYL